MTDDELLADLVPRASAGDRAAAQRVLAIVHPRIVRYCRARMGEDGPVSPEDVAQEASLAVASALPRYEDRGRPFMAFAYGVAAHKVADVHRAHGRDWSQPVAEPPESEDEDVGPEDVVLALDGGNAVRELLDSLNDRARDIIILRVFEGLSAEETGRVVGASAGAVRVAQHRALAKMRAIVEKRLEEGRS